MHSLSNILNLWRFTTMENVNKTNTTSNETMANRELVAKFSTFTRLISECRYHGIYSYYKNLLYAFPIAMRDLGFIHRVRCEDCNFEEAKILNSLFKYEEIANTIDAVISGEIKPTDEMIKLMTIKLYEYNKIVEATAKDIISKSLQTTTSKANIFCNLLVDLAENSDKPWSQTLMHYRQAIEACIAYNHSDISSVEVDEYVDMIVSDVVSILKRSSRDTFDVIDKAISPAFETNEVNDEKIGEAVNDLIELTDTVIFWYLPKNENTKYKVSEIISDMKAHI